MTWQRLYENPLHYSDAHDAWCDTRTGRCGPNAPAGLRAAGVALMSPHGRVLFLQRPDGVWELPGGGIEPGERPQQAAVREVLEETGFKSFSLCPDGFRTSPAYMLYWGSMTAERTPTLTEHRAHLWACPEQPPRPLHPGLSKVFP